ncbi:MAG: isocitrate/isopropylmalate dehydrogenase family protein [Alphaproteobacteria bacterium]|nr:isocitrate/isopropylmalate dehydrogenase family protein [Alphaproteobacteria bacterium]
MSNALKFVVMEGDGIGPEITEATLAVLRAADARFKLGLSYEHHEIGLPALSKHGTTFPDSVEAACRAADGIILGPVDTYAYPAPDKGGINVSAAVRKRLDLYANMRPSKSRPGAPALRPGVDLVIARENTEGFYADRTMFMGIGEFMPTPDLALAVRKITRESSARICKAACELAMTRRRKLTIVGKANVLKMSDGLFRRVCEEVAKGFPALAVDYVLVDAMASLLVRDPARFDVIVTTNMFGDILSNLAAEMTGGLGLGGSVNAGDEHCLAQASHGSAPDIAGKDLANPAALILSAGMLLGWLGRRKGRDDLAQAGAAVERAADAVIKAGKGTRDAGGTNGCTGYGRAVAEAIATI